MREQLLPMAVIRRPLQRVLDPGKVEALAASIAAEGLREPIDVLELDGRYWGFNGCHRWAAHQALGLSSIRARIRRATPDVLRLHML
jgi:sulfiredoxin